MGALRELHDLRHPVSRAEEKQTEGVRGDLGMEWRRMHPLIHSAESVGEGWRESVGAVTSRAASGTIGRGEFPSGFAGTRT
jgi:hypothetical protein